MVKNCKGTIEKDGIIYGITEGNSLIVLDGKHAQMKSVAIPEAINGMLVVGICEWAFSKSLIQGILIPPSVIFVGQSAFDGCMDLKVAIFEADKVALAYRAFANCPHLGRVEGRHLSVNSDSVFWKCSRLKNIYALFTGTVFSKTFGMCKNLEAVSFDDDVTLCHDVFYGCSSLKTLYFKGRVTVPDDYIHQIAKRKIVCHDDCNLVDLGFTGTTVIVTTELI